MAIIIFMTLLFVLPSNRPTYMGQGPRLVTRVYVNLVVLLIFRSFLKPGSFPNLGNNSLCL